MTKDELIKAIDRLRKDKRSLRRGTPQYEQRIRLEQQLELGLYNDRRATNG